MSVQIQQKITGYSVVQPVPATASSADATPSTSFADDADRRLRIENVPTPLAASLRWASRPNLPQGNDGRTYFIRGPEHKFFVNVGHVQNGHAEPFEVWAMGEAPRGLSSIAKSLSMDMRSRDRGYLKAKLEALSRTKGKAFDMTMPDGLLVRCKSEVGAFAQIILSRCQELGAFDDASETPVLDALMSRKEPKTTAKGATAFFCDIDNPATGDNFTLFAKEAVLPNGQRRPFSVWLSGEYPESLDGLCKTLSYDLRVVEIEWGLRKLRQLLDVTEDRGEFFAEVPGLDGKRQSYPSTVAYIAAVILHRLQALGLVNEEGNARVESGVVSLQLVQSTAASKSVLPKGSYCESCGGVDTRIRTGGCDVCTACSASTCG